MKEVATFKKFFKRLVKNCVNEDDEVLFHTQKTHLSMLSGPAIKNKVPTIKSIPKIDEEDQTKISLAILRLKRISNLKKMRIS